LAFQSGDIKAETLHGGEESYLAHYGSVQKSAETICCADARMRLLVAANFRVNARFINRANCRSCGFALLRVDSDIAIDYQLRRPSALRTDLATRARKAPEKNPVFSVRGWSGLVLEACVNEFFSFEGRWKSSPRTRERSSDRCFQLQNPNLH